MTRHCLHLLAILVATVAALSGCGPSRPRGGTSPSHTPAPTPTSSVARSATPDPGHQVLQPTWVSEREYVGVGRRVGDRVLAVAVGREPGWVDLAALDAATGREVWRRPWSPNGAGSRFGVGHTIVGSGTDAFVVFVADGGEKRDPYVPHQAIVAVHVADGASEVVVDRAYTTAAPRPCEVGVTQVCAGIQTPRGRWSWLAYDPMTGKREEVDGLGAREHLYAGWTETRADDGLPAGENERIALVRAGREVSAVRSRDILPGPVGSSDLTLGFGSDKDAPAILWVQGPHPDLGRSVVVGLRPRDGGVAWRREGLLMCGVTFHTTDPALFAACEGSGGVGDPAARLSMVLVERATGRTVRGHALDAADYNVARDAGVEPVLRDGESLVVRHGAKQVLDTATGALRPFDPDAQPCWEETTITHRLHDGGPITAGRRVRPCGDGPDTDRTLTRAQVDAWGLEDGLATMLRGNRVYAYRP